MKTFGFLLLIITINLQAAILEVNSQHSRLGFTVDYMEVSSVEGQFTEYKGQMDFEAKNQLLKVADFSIKTASIFTADTKRDAHLKGKDFFDHEHYPEILIHVDHIVLPAKKSVSVPVEITIKNNSLKRNFQIINKGEVKDPWGKVSQFFTVEGIINRQDFNLKWNRTIDRGGLLVGDEVKIKATLEWQITGKKTPFSRFYIPVSQSLDTMAKIHRGELPPQVPVQIKVPESTLSVLPTAAATSIPVESKKKFDNNAPLDWKNIWIELILGFVGFVLTTALCIGIKIQFAKKLTKDGRELGFWGEILGDSFVIMVVFTYSVIFYRYLYH